MSAAAKLCGFLLLLAVVFAGAYAAGAHVGPVAPGKTPAGTSSTSSGGSGGGLGGMP